MGCGGSQFVEEPEKFIKKPFGRDLQYLNNDIVSESETKVTLKQGLYQIQEDFTVMKSGGGEFLKIINSTGRKKVCTADGTLITVLIFSVRYSEVNAVDAAFNLPHIYIYSTRPFKEGQPQSEYQEGKEALYMWARVHKVANVGTPKFEIAMAEFEGSSQGANIEKFGYCAYVSTMFGPGKLSISKGSNGCCHCIDATGSGSYDVTIAANIDPALMISIVMSIESLKER